jgi:hypothetical protein
VFATAGGVCASDASSSRQDSAPLPCSTGFHRLAGGTRLSLSLTCTTANVAIVRVDFPHTLKLRAQTSFPGAGCRASTPSTWYCLFMAGTPADTKITGTVRFTKTIPRTALHAHLDFYLGSFSGPADLPAAMVGINPTPLTGTFAY